jgi:ectoine hydroxylase-related dioxygenase (phytanoyl-CoA dioxygenase family)
MDHASPDQLREQGFFITPPLIGPESIKEVENEFTRLWREDIQRVEKDGKPADVEFVRLRPFLSALEKRSPVCAAFCKHPRLLGLARELLGADIDLTWNQAIIKPPGKGKPFAWHQDAHYALKSDNYSKGIKPDVMVDSSRFITFWIAITRTTVDNGTLWVVPGMHRQGVLPHVWSEEQREWQCQFDDSWKIPIVLKPGQVLVFTNLVPHCSGPNVSKEVRMAYQIGYGIPGFLRNQHQVPLLRGGTEVR